MSAGPGAPGPRLVYDADAPPGAVHAQPTWSGSDRRHWIAIIVLTLALLGAAFEWHRANVLETRVGALTADLETARAEIGARRAQLDAIRASVDDVRARVEGLASLAAREPSAPPAQQPAVSPHR